ncbi:HGxxPAAW family protein [Streptomyces sp. NPDC046805]|uniref:HGxxPAAW family protein n=1 Tax=Streptomyces sp. NPDC046805 TaxID=3155134 RepID=UPI0033FA3859
MSGHLHDEGHTVAGWTGFLIGTVGSTMVAAGVVVPSPVMVGGGVVIVAISVLVTWALHLAGWGKPPGRRPRDTWPMRVRDRSAREGHPGCVGCLLAGRGQRSAVVAARSVPGSGEPEPAGAEAGI